MKKMIAGLAASAVLFLGGMASAECFGCHESNVNININGAPFLGRAAMIDERPFVSFESLSNALNLPRKHNYKAWNLDRGGLSAGNPLTHLVRTRNKALKTVRFGGVTMVDLYEVASSLDMQVHHNFNTKTIQIGKNYTGENTKGAVYRHLSRARGWRLQDDFGRFVKDQATNKRRDRTFNDSATRRNRI